MYQDNEVIMLILGLSVLIFAVIRRREVTRISADRLLMGSFAVLVAAYIFTVLEGWWYPVLFNFAEHVCYALSSILLAVHTFHTFERPKGLE